MTMKQVRDKPDLFEIIKDLQERISSLERSPRLGTSSVDSGELTITNGNIVVRDSEGTPILSIIGGDVPVIEMQPNGGTDYKIIQSGWESSSQGAACQISIAQLVGDVQDGGKLLLMRDAAYLSHQPNGAAESFYGAGVYGAENLFMKGRFGNNLMDADGLAAIVCGYINVSAGVSSYSHTYPITSAADMIPVVSMTNSAGALAGCLTSYSNSGFVFAWSGTLAKTITFWAFRVG
jgi:hypothetical protein